MNQNSMPNVVEQEKVSEQKETKIAHEEEEENEQELVRLAYEAVTLTSPTDQMVKILAYVGIFGMQGEKGGDFLSVAIRRTKNTTRTLHGEKPFWLKKRVFF
jgi:hypothetical protein